MSEGDFLPKLERLRVRVSTHSCASPGANQPGIGNKFRRKIRRELEHGRSLLNRYSEQQDLLIRTNESDNEEGPRDSKCYKAEHQHHATYHTMRVVGEDMECPKEWKQKPQSVPEWDDWGFCNL
jgi:hypothetical protein